MEAQPSLNHQPPSDHEKLIPSAPAQASGPSASYLARPLSRVDAPAHRASYALTHSQSAEDVAENHFAGRLGAGQRYTYAEECSSTTLGPSPSKPADAYRDPPWRYLLSPAPFRSPGLWKLAFIEGVGTCLQVYLSGLLGHALIPTATEVSIGPVLPVALASIGQVFLISLFIYATGPITGAHFNPLITLGTFCARLSSLPRTVLYVFFQCLGAVVGAYLLQAGLGVGSHELGPFPGCYIDTSLVTGGEAYVFLLFLSRPTLELEELFFLAALPAHSFHLSHPIDQRPHVLTLISPFPASPSKSSHVSASSSWLSVSAWIHATPPLSAHRWHPSSSASPVPSPSTVPAPRVRAIWALPPTRPGVWVSWPSVSALVTIGSIGPVPFSPQRMFFIFFMLFVLYEERLPELNALKLDLNTN